MKQSPFFPVDFRTTNPGKKFQVQPKVHRKKTFEKNTGRKRRGFLGGHDGWKMGGDTVDG